MKFFVPDEIWGQVNGAAKALARSGKRPGPGTKLPPFVKPAAARWISDHLPQFRSLVADYFLTIGAGKYRRKRIGGKLVKGAKLPTYASIGRKTVVATENPRQQRERPTAASGYVEGVNPGAVRWTVHNTRLDVWEERGFAAIRLYAVPSDKLIIDWHDEDARQAVEDGFLDPRDLHGSAVDYANHIGAGVRGKKRNPLTKDETRGVLRTAAAHGHVASGYVKGVNPKHSSEWTYSSHPYHTRSCDVCGKETGSGYYSHRQDKWVCLDHGPGQKLKHVRRSANPLTKAETRGVLRTAAAHGHVAKGFQRPHIRSFEYGVEYGTAAVAQTHGDPAQALRAARIQQTALARGVEGKHARGASPLRNPGRGNAKPKVWADLRDKAIDVAWSVPNQQWFVLFGRGPIETRSILFKGSRAEVQTWLDALHLKKLDKGPFTEEGIRGGNRLNPLDRHEADEIMERAWASLNLAKSLPKRRGKSAAFMAGRSSGLATAVRNHARDPEWRDGASQEKQAARVARGLGVARGMPGVRDNPAGPKRNPLDSHKPGCQCMYHSGRMFKKGGRK